MKLKNNEYVQYGCGWSASDGWRNFDSSPTLRFERIPLLGTMYTKNKSRFPDNVEYGDIVNGLPLSIGSCKAIYCSHVLEHLSLADFRKALLNTHGVLQPGGVFRLVLPDLEYYAKKYIDDTSTNAALLFMKATGLGQEKRSRSLRGFLATWFGNSQHYWMWDYKSIKEELKNVGFIEVRRAHFGDSSDPMFKELEDKSRWDNCLGVECRK